MKLYIHQHATVWSECCDAYGLMIGLLSMFEVIGLHMNIALVDLNRIVYEDLW